MRFQRGPMRILVAPTTIPHPAGIDDVISLADEVYDPQPGWNDGGTTRTGIMANGLGSLLGADDDPTADQPGHWVATQLHSEDVLRRHYASIGRPVKIAFLWPDVDADTIEGHYFPMAVCDRFVVGTGRGECSTTTVKWNVGPHGYRRLGA